MVPALVLFALVLTAAFAPRFGRPGALALALVSVLWLFANHRVEGHTVLVLTPSHGVTTADFASAAGLLVASWTWWRTL